MADETKKVLIDLQLDTSDIDKSVLSLKSLSEANKKLREERKLVNFETEEGRKRIEQLNQQIDKNDKLIKQNSSSLEKQRLNVGNYTKSIQDAIPALDGMTGGAASATQGLASMTKSALAFIATPIGAVIAALGLALGALMTYFKGSDQAQDKFAEGTAIVGVALDGLKLIVEKVGEVVLKTFEFINGIVKNFIDFVAPSVGKQLDAIILQGKLVAKLADDLENLENANLIKRASIEQKVAKLRADAIKQEGDQKRATIEEAIRLEQQLSAVNVEEAKKRLGVFLSETKTKGDLTGEENKKKAELIAAVVQAETEQFESTLRFEKQLEALKDEKDKKEEERRKKEDEAALAEAKRQSDKEIAEQKELERLANLVQFKTEQVDFTIAEDERLSEAEQKQLDKTIERAKARAAWAKVSEDQKLAYTSNALRQTAALLDKESDAYKALATGQAIIDTYRAATAALAPPPVGAGPIFGPIFAGIAIATGLANIAKIQGVKFAEGGSVLGNGVRWGTVGGRSHSDGGTKYYGSDGNVVELERNEGFFVAKVDAHREFIDTMSGLNQKHGGNSWLGRSPLRRFAEGGAVSFSNQSAFDNRQLAELINQVKVAVVIDDVEAKAIEKNDRVNRAQVI